MGTILIFFAIVGLGCVASAYLYISEERDLKLPLLAHLFLAAGIIMIIIQIFEVVYSAIFFMENEIFDFITITITAINIIGLYRVRKWALKMFFICFLLAIVLTIIELIVGKNLDKIPFTVLTLVLIGLVVFYFHTPRIKNLFR